MVRRRVEAATQDNNENSGLRRRTSTPEIVRIRTTEQQQHQEAVTDSTASTREDAPPHAAASSRSESNKGNSGSASVQHSADVIRHGLTSNSEIVVRKGCDQDEARHRPASGAEVVRYKVESQLPVNAGSNNSAVGGFEKKSGAKNQNQISSTSGTSSDKDKKQQMPLRHQVS